MPENVSILRNWSLECIRPYSENVSIIYLLKLNMQYAFVLIITIIIIGGSTCSSSMKFNYSVI